jgi:hypothetical protein
MLVARVLTTKRSGAKREVTRARLSELTVRRLFGRRRISPAFLLEVNEWLFRAGWVLFFAGSSYAVINLKVVEGWQRVSSKRIAEDLDKVGEGLFEFASLERLLRPESGGADED